MPTPVPSVPTSLEQAIELIQPYITKARELIEHLAKTDEPFCPVYFVFTAQGMSMEPMPFDSDNEKDGAALLMRLIAAAAQPFGLWGALFISDVRTWMVGPENAEVFKQRADDPTFDYAAEVKKRGVLSEGLLVRLETYYGDHNQVFGYQRRGTEIVWSDEPGLNLGGVYSGRFTNFLPPLPVSGGQA
jgi:hypothetical protein